MVGRGCGTYIGCEIFDTVMPKRHQRTRAKGYKAPPNTRFVGKVGRGGNSKAVDWSNPFRVVPPPEKGGSWAVKYPGGAVGFYESKREAHRIAVKLYRGHLRRMIEDDNTREKFVQLNCYDYLSCWCPIDMPSHVDIMIEELEQLRHPLYTNPPNS